MDIRNKKPSRHTHIKNFSLKLTASAILTLNAEAVMAVNCPTEIYGNTLAGIICNFNGIPPSGSSVTVENGGTVGGIHMGNYQPTHSFITVDAGGLVSNTSGIGIAITSSSSLSNGLSNNGTISAQSGIGITANSVVNGGISNSGLISTVDAGISVNTSTISNGLSNSGTISSTSGVGISILNTSTINGGISNSGVINASTYGISIGGNSLINGDIFNSKTIDSNLATGILITSSTISGSIFNSGTISGGTVDSGITITANSTVSGDITNQGLINATSGNALDFNQSVITGGMSNSGKIESTNVDGIHVSDVSTIQSNITNSGTVIGGRNGISILSSSTVGGIVNSGTISGGNNGLNISLSTINGNITNTGTIRGGTTGINITSSAVSGGISNSGTIQGDIFAIYTSGGLVNNIDILGKTARIIGAVDATNTDVNITNGAIFTSEGSYNVNTFNIAENAVFNMANTITVASGFNNSGTLATNTLQVIAGDYTQDTGGLFQTGVSSITSYGQLSVSGTANLSQSGNIYVQVAPNALLQQGSILSNIISGNTFISPTDGFNVTDNSYVWTFLPSLNHSNNGVNLTATINPDAYNVCQGTYCQGAATTIIGQIAAGNPVFLPYISLPTANAFQEAVSQATPEITNANTQAIQLVTNAVMDIVPMWSTLHGKSGGDAMLYPAGKVWLKPYIASMTQNESNSVNGFNARANGVVIGKDVQLAQDWLLGGAFSLGGNTIHGNAPPNGQAINSNVYQGMLYGAKRFLNHVYFAGQGLVGYQNNNTQRAIPLYASTANGSFNNWFSNLRAQLGWNVYALDQDLVLTPELDASYLFVHRGSFQESGSPMDLLVTSNNNSSLVCGAYGHGAYRLTRLNLQDFTIAAYAGIARNVLNSQPQTTATFVAGGSSFSTFGVQTNKTVFRGGVGLSFENPTKPLRVSLNYDLQTNSTSYSSVGEITVAYKI